MNEDRRTGHALDKLLIILIAYLLLGLLIAFSYSGSPRVLLAVFLSFFGAGYMLITVLLPDRSELDDLEIFLLSGASSLAINGILYYLISQSYWGLTLEAAFLSALILNVAFYLLYRWKVSALRSGSLSLGGSLLNLWAEMTELVSRLRTLSGIQTPVEQNILSVVLLICLLAAGAYFNRSLLLDPPSHDFTEFYLIAGDGSIDNFPLEVLLAATVPFEYGVSNHEGERENYYVEVIINAEVIYKSDPISLDPGETFQGTVDVDVTETWDTPQKIIFELLNDGLPIRRLYIWLKPLNPSNTGS